MRKCILLLSFLPLYLVICLSGSALGGDPDGSSAANAPAWPSWRGVHQNGESAATNLISNWSPDGTNMIWRHEFIGRSTPVILNGRVYVIGRTGQGLTMQEQVACFDARDGKLLWEHHEPVRNTYAPFSRVGWASMAGDPETGNVYSVGTAGIVNCFDQNGKILWTVSMIEDFGARTGYGGRTTNAVVDEDRVVIAFVSAGWGDQKPMKHRQFAFNKRTGEVVWMSTPSDPFKSPNIQSNPVIAEINGVRLLIGGNSDGHIYAVKSRTGEKVWDFHLSQGGINTSVAVDGYRVYAAHGEENIDTAEMGRIVCIDGRGEGEITKTHELWRYSAEVGYTSPLLHDGRAYFVDNAANLIALNGADGSFYWKYSLGTVGKGSPVWADGKIYATETNGKFHILKPADTECVSLDEDVIMMPSGERHAEIYSSPAIAYNRIYFATEGGLFCLGDPSQAFKIAEGYEQEQPAAAAGKEVAHIQIVPAEINLSPGETASFTATSFDARGNRIGTAEVQWSAEPALGTITAAGVLTTAAPPRGIAGLIKGTAAGVTGVARVRVFPNLPYTEDFESYKDDDNPPHWIGVSSIRSPGGKFVVRTVDGNRVLAKPLAQKGIQRHIAYLGPANMTNYVIQVDAMDHKDKRRRGDAGLVSHGYELDLMGKKQRLEIRQWTSEQRLTETMPFSWEPETWYTIKMDVEQLPDKAIVRGKVWKRGDPEPADWTISIEDPLPTRIGSPGLYGVSYTEVFFDNVVVTQR